jgi:hypothetical protein
MNFELVDAIAPCLFTDNGVLDVLNRICQEKV